MLRYVEISVRAISDVYIVTSSGARLALEYIDGSLISSFPDPIGLEKNSTLGLSESES